MLAGLVVTSLVAAGADPHSMLVVPERLSSLDVQAGKIARDVSKLDRDMRELERAAKGRDAGTPNLAEAKSALGELRAAVERALGDLRKLKGSKDGVTVDAAKAMADRLSELEERVLRCREREQVVIGALKKP